MKALKIHDLPIKIEPFSLFFRSVDNLALRVGDTFCANNIVIFRKA
jgi:hypothetical protein